MVHGDGLDSPQNFWKLGSRESFSRACMACSPYARPTQCLPHGVHAWGLSCKLPETLRSPPNTVPCEHSIALISKQIRRWGFLGRQCVADPILCERFDWIDTRAQLAIVCERFARPGDSVRARPVASAVRSGSDRSYLSPIPPSRVHTFSAGVSTKRRRPA